MEPPCILFLAANPQSTSRLALDEEVRGFAEQLRASGVGDRIELRIEWAVRAQEIPTLLLRHRPQIVHFSGRGSRSGELLFVGQDSAAAAPVSPEILRRMFEELRDDILCVVLSACYSSEQAAALVQVVPCVVGLSRAVRDHAAKAFVVGFYQRLASGQSVHMAFNQGRTQTDLGQVGGQHELPHFLVQPGLDAERLTLLDIPAPATLPSSSHTAAGAVPSSPQAAETHLILCFSSKDAQGKAEVATQLAPLLRGSVLSLWSTDDIPFGTASTDAFAQEVERADAALLLLSADFLVDSKVEEQLALLREKHSRRALRIIPLVWRACNWQAVDWLGPLLPAPRDGSPLMSMDKPRREHELVAIVSQLQLRPARAQASVASARPQPVAQLRGKSERIQDSRSDLAEHVLDGDGKSEQNVQRPSREQILVQKPGNPMAPIAQLSTTELVITEQEIERSNILDNIDHTFQTQTSNIDTIFISGTPGIGKTTLLRQFSLRHAEVSVSIFIRTQSRWAYDAQCIMHQIAEKINELLGHNVEADAKFDIADLQGLYLDLQRKARRTRKYYYFVIDGLEDIPHSDAECKGEILGLLPFGIPGIRFLLSTNPKINIHGIVREWRPMELPLSGLSVAETAQFFKEFKFNERQIEDIRRTCHGSPGIMASIRRSARNSPDINAFLAQLPQETPGIFELEWKIVESMPEAVIDCLAILAYVRKNYSISELATIVGQGENQLNQHIFQLPFIDAGKNNQIEYISESFKLFATNKLRHKYRDSHEKIISHLLRNPSSDEALFEVPRLLNDIGKMDELLAFLTTPNHFALLLERSESIETVKQKTQLGIKAASRLYRDDDLVRFGLQLASARMISNAEGWQSEIEARIALDDIQGARKLALSALVRESRFHMLVSIAKVMYEQNRNPDEDILAQMLQIYKTLDFSEMGDKAFKIASDLVSVRPDLAMEIVETISKRKASKPETFDWALARLSMEAEASIEPSREEKGYNVSQSIQSRITDPVAKQFSRAVSILLGKFSADEVWIEASRILNPGNRVSYLRYWVVRHQKKPEAARIAEQALQLAIGTTSYSLTASVLRDLATSLSSISDDTERERLLSMFDAQRAAADKIGPTEDYIDFWLLLAKARSRLEPKQSLSDLIDIYFHISYITETSTKAACMARLMALLPEIDKERKLEVSDRLHTTVELEFIALVEKLLSASADHIVATSSILRALAQHSTGIALKICSQLNSPIRRDEAKLILVRAVCIGEPDEQCIQTCLEITAQIQLVDIREAAWEAIVRFVFTDTSVDLKPQAISDVAMLIDNVKSPSLICQLASLAFSWLKKQNLSAYEPVLMHMRKILSESWSQIDGVWSRVDAGFEVAKLVAGVDRELAHAFVLQADSLRREHLLGTEDTATAFYWCIKLILVAYSGLFSKRLDTEKDENHLEILINRIPGIAAKACIWADIAFRYYIAKRREDCVRIVSRYLRPLIDELQSVSYPGAQQMIAQCMPCIYLASQLVAIEMIKKLSYPYSDGAIYYIREVLLSQKSPFDVCDPVDVKAEFVKYSDIVELLELSRVAVADSLSFWIIDGITDAITSKKNKDRFSSQQRLEIARRIEALSLVKFPNPEFIKHAGWKILADVCVAKIKNADKTIWLDVATRARGIPNVADRVLVLEILAMRLPSSLHQFRRELIEEACKDANSIPVPVDRIIRLRSIAQSCASAEPSIARCCVTNAMKLAINVEDEDSFALDERRRLVDLAYKMDPKLAEEVADLGDNDPARVRARHQMSQEITVLKLRKQLIDEKVSGGPSDGGTRAQNQEAAWRTLATLNAGKANSFTRDQAREHLRRGASLSFEDAFPSFLLGVGSLVRKYAGTDEASAYLRPMFDGLVRSTEIAWRLIARTIGLTPPLFVEPILTDSSIMIENGNREKALQFIDKWIVENVGNNLVICDPFFGPEDLEIVARIQSIIPECEIKILTSPKQQNGAAPAYSEAFSNQWKWHISESEPPSTEIYVLQSELDSRNPLHERWILSENSGLSIGVSLNLLGTTPCVIDYLSSNAVRVRAAEVEKILSRQMKAANGQRVRYHSFNL